MQEKAILHRSNMSFIRAARQIHAQNGNVSIFLSCLYRKYSSHAKGILSISKKSLTDVFENPQHHDMLVIDVRNPDEILQVSIIGR